MIHIDTFPLHTRQNLYYTKIKKYIFSVSFYSDYEGSVIYLTSHCLNSHHNYLLSYPLPPEFFFFPILTLYNTQIIKFQKHFFKFFCILYSANHRVYTQILEKKKTEFSRFFPENIKLSTQKLKC